MYFKENKGVTLLALTITIIVMLIISGTVIYNSNNHIKIEKINKLYNDIETLSAKVENYYQKYGEVPTYGKKYCDKDLLVSLFNKNASDNGISLIAPYEQIINANDGDEYYLIELEKLEGLMLNYGYGEKYDYEKAKEVVEIDTSLGIQTETTIDELDEVADEVYIINKESHQIYYPSGIFAQDSMYYSYKSSNDDTIDLVDNSSAIGYTTIDRSDLLTLSSFKLYGNTKTSDLPSLPDEYQQLQYIESTGTQYIDTGITCNNNLKIEIKYYVPTIGSERNYICGVYGASNGYRVQYSHANVIFAGYGNKYNNNIEAPQDDKIYDLLIDNGKFILDGKEIYDASSAGSKYSTSNDKTIALFATNSNGTINYNSSVRIYSFYTSINEIYTSYLVPCYLKTNENICGMYDLVKGEFYENKGTGTFVKGNNILNRNDINITSVGDIISDENDENYGKYKVPIVIRGKNLIDQELLMGNKLMQKNDEGYVASSYPLVYYNDSDLVKLLKKVIKPDVTYTLSRYVSGYKKDSSGSIWIRDSSSTIVSVREGNGVRSVTFSLTQDQIDSIDRIYVYGHPESPVTYHWIQLEEGSTATSYEPYYEKTTNIYLSEPLRKIGGYVDYIDLENSKIIRQVGKYYFSKNDSWTKGTSATTNGFYRNYIFLKPQMKFGTRVPGLSNVLPSNLNSWNNWSSIQFHYGQVNYALYLITDRAMSSNEDVYNYISNNGNNTPYVIYPLATPTEETLDLLDLQLHKGINNIIIDTKIAPSKIEYISYKINE